MTGIAASRTSSDSAYSDFERTVAARVASLRGPLFTTNAAGLFDAYLAGIPEEFRQHYTCHCCRKFVDKYGALLAIHDFLPIRCLAWNASLSKPR